MRSIDRSLNDYVDDCGDYACSWDNLPGALDLLPRPNGDEEYYLLAIDLSDEAEAEARKEWLLLGYDLTDETHTSSVLNCGPWEGELEPLAARLNQYGLLSRDDAQLAQKLLLKEWGEEEPHAHVTIWALHEHRPADNKPLDGIRDPER